MKLIEKLSKDYANQKNCCCANAGCGGQAQYEAFEDGFNMAVDLMAEEFGWVQAGNIQHEMQAFGEQQVPDGSQL